MKGWLIAGGLSLVGGVAGVIKLVKTYGLPWAIGKLHKELEHEDPDDKALMVALLTWVRRRGPSFGFSYTSITAMEEKALAGIPEDARKAIEDLTLEALKQADKELEG